MKAKYLGHPDHLEDTPRFVKFAGVSFQRDTWAEIPANIDPKLLAKLQENPAFEYSDGELTAAERKEAEKVVEGAVLDPFDHDGDGKAGGSLSKNEVLAKLEALGQPADEKLSLTKLRAQLEAAEFEAGGDD